MGVREDALKFLKRLEKRGGPWTPKDLKQFDRLEMRFRKEANKIMRHSAALLRSKPRIR